MLAFTIIAGNYSAMAHVLLTSVREVHPEMDLAVVIVDRSVPPSDELCRLAEVVRLDDIDFGDEGWGRMAVSYDVTEFSTAVKPFAARHFIRRGEDVVLYLDPDILVTGRLDRLIDGVRARSIALTPHCLQPMARDGRLLSEGDILRSGIYNLGFLGVGAGSEPFLDWWAERLRRDAIIDESQMLFTDQRWIDLSVPIFAPHIEESPAFNVAYWNVDQRPVTTIDGQWFAGGQPMGFFHFSGYDPRRPHLLSKFMGPRPRVLLSEEPALRELTARYAALLGAAGHDAWTQASYGWEVLPPDIVLTRGLRRTYRDECVLADRGEGELPPDPFAPGGYEEFLAWLAAPMPAGPTALPRLHAPIWEAHPEVHAHLSSARRGDPRPFYNWLWERPKEIAALSIVVPIPLRTAPGKPMSLEDLNHGVLIVEHPDVSRPVTAEAIALMSALQTVGVDAAVDTTTRHGMIGAGTHAGAAGVKPFDVELVVANAQALRSFVVGCAGTREAGGHRVGYWFWDGDVLPAGVPDAFNQVDEVWVPTRFLERALGPRPPKPVAVVPLPLETVDSGEVDSPAFTPRWQPSFLVITDLSIDDGGDAEWAIEAFSRAFQDGDGPKLVVATYGSRDHLDRHEWLRHRRGDRRDIELIAADSPYQGAADLLAVHDVYVSLRLCDARAVEVAVAARLGKPIVVVGSAGPLDIVDDLSAEVVSVVRSTGGQPGDKPASASVDLDEAVSAMRRVALDRHHAILLGAVARERSAALHSPAMIGALMRDRLDRFWRRRDDD